MYAVRAEGLVASEARKSFILRRVARTERDRDLFDRDAQLLKPKQLRSIQEERIRKIVRYAYRNVPFYRKRFDEAGVKPESIRTLDDVAKIPFTMKADLRDNYPLGILAVPPRRLYCLHASSGTTGKADCCCVYSRGP